MSKQLIETGFNSIEDQLDSVDWKAIKLFSTAGNAKLDKTTREDLLVAGLSLAPANESGYELCPGSSPGCRKACLMFQGRGKFQNVRKARIRKARLFVEQRKQFLAKMNSELDALERKAKREDLTIFVRPNVLQDIAWELQNPEMFQRTRLRFYDYTARAERFQRYLEGRFPFNYDLIFSRKENNEKTCLEFLKAGGNVNVVWRYRKDIPETWHGYPVALDQDDTDLWWLGNVSTVGGAFAKGSAKQDTTGFVL